MSPAQREVKSWGGFWAELVERLGSCDLASRSPSKFEDMSAWLATEWKIPAGELVCKYVHHSKNRWNRLREASRRAPAAILLLLEGDDSGELEARVSETAAVCPTLRLLVALVRPSGGAWALRAVFYRESTSLPPILAAGVTPVAPVAFIAEAGSHGGEPLPPEREGAGDRLAGALRTLGTAGLDPASPHRGTAAQALVDLLGCPPDRVAFKTIPSSKNVGNRLGEALARMPTILVVVCPEMLEDRVLEEVERWETSDGLALILVLCGEETHVRVSGPHGEIVLRLRACLGLDEPRAAGTVDGVALRQEEPFDWRAWSYEDWNQGLVDYCLSSDGQDRDSVERLAATPEELVLLAGGVESESQDIVGAFVEACLSNIPGGRSFFGFCGSLLGRRRASEIPWTPKSPEPPYFFAMLWFTCLIAYGYPDAEGGFYDRFRRLVGNVDSLQGLPGLWLEVWEWTYRRSEAGESIRVLNLPPKDDFRTNIGETHFLAFPHKHDRRQIARVLVEADLVGFEPPIAPVVSKLRAEEARFSKLFREDLDNFDSRFVDGGCDPRESAFWRAVRQEALNPSYGVGARKARGSATSMLGVFDDEGFLPLLGCEKTWSPPPGYRMQPLDNPCGRFEWHAVAEDGGLEAVCQAMFESIGLLGPGPRALINQGVLIFQEDQSDEFFVVSGHDASGADLALVRDDLLHAFTDVFGGRAEPARVSGWSQVTGCAVKPLDAPPAALESVVHLQRTMSPPNLRFVSGIQVPGGYLGIEGFLPRLRAPEAVEVRVVAADRDLACSRAGEDEWSLPSALLNSLPVRCKVVGGWRFGDGSVRTSNRALHLKAAVIDDEFRPLAGGDYFAESCRPGQKSIVGGQPIALGITTGDATSSIDLLDFEPSMRFLGPGQGELSTERRPGFDWLAVGHKNHPELLVYVGDARLPTLPADRRSPAPGDRRHWRLAFTRADDVRVRTPDGTYHDIAEFPHVLRLHGLMASHNPTLEASTCQETGLDTISLRPPHRSQPRDATLSVADALAALSTRRSGLRYRTVQQLFEELTGGKDYLLHHELIRAWTESGALDLVRSQSYSATRLVARQPRFVVVRRGPLLEASLIGLVTRVRAAQVRRLAGELGAVIHELQPGCPWQPTVIRIRAPEAVVVEIGTAAGLAPLEWLTWTQGDSVPEHLHVDVRQQDLWTGSPPAGFSLATSWSWETAEFRRFAQTGQSGVQIEKRVHRGSCSIYVVLVDGSPRLWTHVRNWALLYAHVVAEKPPFVLDRSGWVITTGRSPVHLPLPLGRLCAVFGEGLSGPVLDPETKGVEGYCYPFGRRVTDLLARVIPATWQRDEES